MYYKNYTFLVLFPFVYNASTAWGYLPNGPTRSVCIRDCLFNWPYKFVSISCIDKYHTYHPHTCNMGYGKIHIEKFIYKHIFPWTFDLATTL